MMQMNMNQIMLDEHMAGGDQQFLLASQRQSETGHIQAVRSRSTRKASTMRKAASPRPERGQSALLPQLENNRYPSSGRGMAGGELDNSHMLNFVKTSKKQMRDVIG